jgi:hypothetical protein
VANPPQQLPEAMSERPQSDPSPTRDQALNPELHLFLQPQLIYSTLAARQASPCHAHPGPRWPRPSCLSVRRT